MFYEIIFHHRLLYKLFHAQWLFKCMINLTLVLICAFKTEALHLLVMHDWLKGLYYELNSKYSITLLFFDSTVQTSHKLNACCVYHACAYVCVYMSICVLRGHVCNRVLSHKFTNRSFCCSYIDTIMSGKVLIAYGTSSGAQYTNVLYTYNNYIVSNSKLKGYFALYYLASH